MIAMFAQSLIWAALTALPLILIALVIGRLNLSPKFKAWACRIAFLKLPIGLVPLGLVYSRETVAGPPNRMFDLLIGFLFILWIAGLATVLVDLVRGYFASQKMIHEAQPIDHPAIASLSEGLGLRCPLVKQGLEPGLPFAAGIFRPVIVVPALPCEPNVYAHELAHIRSRDMLWNLISRLILGVFWFCPFIHKLEAELALWQESAADQAACETTKCSTKDHALAIVRSVAPASSNLVWDACLSGTGRLVNRRLRALYQGGGSRLSAAVLGVVLILGMTPWRLGSESDDVAFGPVRARIDSGSVFEGPIAEPVSP